MPPSVSVPRFPSPEPNNNNSNIGNVGIKNKKKNNILALRPRTTNATLSDADTSVNGNAVDAVDAVDAFAPNKQPRKRSQPRGVRVLQPLPAARLELRLQLRLTRLSPASRAHRSLDEEDNYDYERDTQRMLRRIQEKATATATAKATRGWYPYRQQRLGGGRKRERGRGPSSGGGKRDGRCSFRRLLQRGSTNTLGGRRR
eukprot:jgi/Psemu1/292701/fgenesh1_pg.1229_\